jgi:myotubularin-related protein 6/7/8
MFLKTFQILHMHIANIDKQQLTTTGSPLLIRCKTFLSVTFVIPKERECHDVYITLMKLCQPGTSVYGDDLIFTKI